MGHQASSGYSRPLDFHTSDYRIFRDGIAQVAVGSKMRYGFSKDRNGFIDTAGNWVIEPLFEGDECELDEMEYDGNYLFSEGLAAVPPIVMRFRKRTILSTFKKALSSTLRCSVSWMRRTPQ